VQRPLLRSGWPDYVDNRSLNDSVSQRRDVELSSFAIVLWNLHCVYGRRRVALGDEIFADPKEMLVCILCESFRRSRPRPVLDVVCEDRTPCTHQVCRARNLLDRRRHGTNIARVNWISVKRFLAIFGSLFLAAALPAWVQLFTNTDTELLIAVLLTIGSAMAAGPLLWLAKSLLVRRGRPQTSDQDPRPRRGLIITVGPGSLYVRDGTTSFARVLGYTQPSHIVLVGTPQTEGSVELQLKDAAVAVLGTSPWVQHVCVDPDLVDLSGVRSAFHQLRALKIPNDQIVVDVTGGTTSMSLSGYLAAQECGLETQLIQQEKNRFNVIGA